MVIIWLLYGYYMVNILLIMANIILYTEKDWFGRPDPPKPAVQWDLSEGKATFCAKKLCCKTWGLELNPRDFSMFWPWTCVFFSRIFLPSKLTKMHPNIMKTGLRGIYIYIYKSVKATDSLSGYDWLHKNTLVNNNGNEISPDISMFHLLVAGDFPAWMESVGQLVSSPTCYA